MPYICDIIFTYLLIIMKKQIGNIAFIFGYMRTYGGKKQ